MPAESEIRQCTPLLNQWIHVHDWIETFDSDIDARDAEAMGRHVAWQYEEEDGLFKPSWFCAAVREYRKRVIEQT